MAGWVSALPTLALPLVSGAMALGAELAAGRRPPLVLDRLDDPRTDLAAFRGQPVIVHFFATWRAPCIEEMASLNAPAAVPDAPAIVNVGETEARLRNVLRQRAFPMLLDPARIARDLAPALRSEAPLDWTSPAVSAVLAALTPANAITLREGSPGDDQPP